MRNKQQGLSKETTTVVSMQQHYSGPLPPAQDSRLMERYYQTPQSAFLQWQKESKNTVIRKKSEP